MTTLFVLCLSRPSSSPYLVNTVCLHCCANSLMLEHCLSSLDRLIHAVNFQTELVCFVSLCLCHSTADGSRRVDLGPGAAAALLSLQRLSGSLQPVSAAERRAHRDPAGRRPSCHRRAGGGPDDGPGPGLSSASQGCRVGPSRRVKLAAEGSNYRYLFFLCFARS